MQGIASRSGCTSVDLQVAIAAVLTAQTQHNACAPGGTSTPETQTMSKQNGSRLFLATHCLAHPQWLACWEVIWIQTQMCFSRSVSLPSQRALPWWEKQQKAHPMPTAMGLGNKYEQLLKKVDEMETHASRTGACCKEPIKELKQCSSVQESQEARHRGRNPFWVVLNCWRMISEGNKH